MSTRVKRTPFDQGPVDLFLPSNPVLSLCLTSTWPSRPGAPFVAYARPKTPKDARRSKEKGAPKALDALLHPSLLLSRLPCLHLQCLVVRLVGSDGRGRTWQRGDLCGGQSHPWAQLVDIGGCS